MAALVRARHPGVPLYLAGESMGGAVALVAADRDDRRRRADPARHGAALARHVRAGGQRRPLVLRPHHPVDAVGPDLDRLQADRQSQDPGQAAQRSDDAAPDTPRHGLWAGRPDGRRQRAPPARVHEPYLMLHGLGDRIVPQRTGAGRPSRSCRRAPIPGSPSTRMAITCCCATRRAPVVAADIVAWMSEPRGRRCRRAPMPSQSQPEMAALWGSKRRPRQASRLAAAANDDRGRTAHAWSCRRASACSPSSAPCSCRRCCCTWRRRGSDTRRAPCS